MFDAMGISTSTGTVDILRQIRQAQLPQIGSQSPIDVAIGCGGQTAVSLAKDLSGVSLLNDAASALAAGNLKPLLNPGDSAELTERGAEYAAGNATARAAVRSVARGLGDKISTKAAGKLLGVVGKKAGAIGAATAVYQAGSEFADCVQ